MPRKRKPKKPILKHEREVRDKLYQAGRLISEANDLSPKACRQYAVDMDHFPAMIPRQRKRFKEWHQKMIDQGILTAGRGNVRNPESPMSVAVEKAYEAVQEKRFRQYMADQKQRGEKYALKEFRKLGRFAATPFEDWKDVLLEAFMNLHNDHPEKVKALRDIVDDATRSGSISSAEYRSLIRQDFVKAARRFSKEQKQLHGIY